MHQMGAIFGCEGDEGDDGGWWGWWRWLISIFRFSLLLTTSTTLAVPSAQTVNGQALVRAGPCSFLFRVRRSGRFLLGSDAMIS